MADQITPILVNRTFSDPDFNCRGYISSSDVATLMRSIENVGLQQPIVVCPYEGTEDFDWQIIMGHCRHESFRQLMYKDPEKYKYINAIVKTGLTEIDKRALNLIENIERTNLNVMQEARAIEKFFKRGLTEDTVAKIINKSRGWVQVRAMATKLQPEIQSKIEAGYISQAQIRDLYEMVSDEARFEAVRDLVDAKLRGEKITIKQKPAKKNESKIRNVTEIFAMQDNIRERIGNNIGTRLLAWVAGVISDSDIEEDIKQIEQESTNAILIAENC